MLVQAVVYNSWPYDKAFITFMRVPQLLSTAEFDIKKESAWAISNATSGGTAEQIKYLVHAGCVRPLCDLLTCSDVRIVTVALEGLENILKARPAVSGFLRSGTCAAPCRWRGWKCCGDVLRHVICLKVQGLAVHREQPGGLPVCILLQVW